MTDPSARPSSAWRRSTEVAVVDHGDRVVVLPLAHPATAVPLVLEGPAVAVWHALEASGTTEEVVARVAADFGFPAAEVRRDVVAFLPLLADRGLVIEEVPRPSG